MGDFDLSTIKMAGSIDIPNKNLKFSLDAPTLLGTKIDALVVGEVGVLQGVRAPSRVRSVGRRRQVHEGRGPDRVRRSHRRRDRRHQGRRRDPGRARQAADRRRRRAPTRSAATRTATTSRWPSPAADLKALDPTASVNGDVELRPLDPQERQPAGQDLLLGHLGRHGHASAWCSSSSTTFRSRSSPRRPTRSRRNAGVVPRTHRGPGPRPGPAILLRRRGNAMRLRRRPPTYNGGCHPRPAGNAPDASPTTPRTARERSSPTSRRRRQARPAGAGLAARRPGPGRRPGRADRRRAARPRGRAEGRPRRPAPRPVPRRSSAGSTPSRPARSPRPTGRC